MKLACQRALFSLPRDVHYLNCAYMGPLPIAAQEAGIAGVRRKAVPGQITAADFFDDVGRARALFARLLGAGDGSRVALVPAVSYSAAIVAHNLTPPAGSRVVLAGEQFPGNVYAWHRLAQRTGLEITTVNAPAGADRGPRWNDALLDAIDARTALVALPHVHWADGTRFDLHAIGAAARRAGAVFVIDATQSLGALPFDLEGIDPDAVFCAGYKWLLGPYSLGYAWFGPRFDDARPLEETWIGRKGSEDFRGLVNYQDEYQPGAARFDVGERSNFILLPMSIASLELILEWGPARIQEYSAAITERVIEEVADLGFTAEDPAWRAGHLFGLRAPAGADLGALQTALVERGVHVSLRGNAVRISPHLYNDDVDVDALIDAIRAAAVAV